MFKSNIKIEVVIISHNKKITKKEKQYADDSIISTVKYSAIKKATIWENKVHKAGKWLKIDIEQQSLTNENKKLNHKHKHEDTAYW